MKTKIQDLVNRFNNKSGKEKIVVILPYVIAIYFSSRFVMLYRMCAGNFIILLQNIEFLIRGAPHFVLTDILIGSCIGCLLIYYIKWNSKMHKKNPRQGVEYGSAR